MPPWRARAARYFFRSRRAWLLAGHYRQAVEHGDAALVSELVAAYVAHMADTLDAARDWAILKTGHDITQITFAHVNRRAADHLADV